MKYQDEWINGSCSAKGKRDCSKRYSIIRDAVMWDPPKTVLDIGANMCYFGIRLNEDFGCGVVAFEFHQFKMRANFLKKTGVKDIIFLERKLSINDLRILGMSCKFDLVLALSVIHHLPGDTSNWISAIRNLGRKTIIEFAGEDSARTADRTNYSIPDDGDLIGYGESHLLSGHNRPIYLFKNK